MKTAKSLLSFILAIVMLFSVAAFPVMAEETEDASVTLTDIDSTSTVGKAVKKLVSMGVINGYPDGTFRPDNSITRAEFCVVMVKFEGMQDYINPNALTGFEDLDTDANYAWARPYVAMAVERGIINGFEDKTFRAADPVTYEQAIKMLVCSLGYGNEAKMPTITGDWSSGYIAKAMQLKVTSGAYTNNKTAPTTRGVVAILTSNALDAERNSDFSSGGMDIIIDEDTMGQLGYEEVKGIVTGTYVTELETGKSYVPKNHIQIDDEIYEVGFSRDPNEYLGCEVTAMVKEAEDFSDYNVVTSLEITRKTSVIEIADEDLGSYTGSAIEYTDSKGRWQEAEIDDEYIVIYNNKAYDYDIANLEDDLENGNVVLVDNNGDNRYDVIRINSYDVFVVSSKKSTSQSITLMYDAEYNGSSTFVLPDESTNLIFSLTRNGKEITFSDIAKWDVLNIKVSPEDAEGRQFYQIEVTRETVSGTVTERDSNDESYIMIGNDEYVIADSFLEYNGDDKPELKSGDYAQVYLDAEGRIVAAAESAKEVTSESYAYLFALRQDSDDSEYELEFKFYTTSGKFIQVGSASKITIDGVKYKALDDDILEYLEGSAEFANSNYPDAENVVYHQPVVYQTNSSGLVTAIDTVKSSENEKISMTMKNEDDEYYYAAYEAGEDKDKDGVNDGIAYKSSSKSFSSFKVSSGTDIIFVPDNRANSEDYLVYTSYSKAFANARTYHVEAYGMSKSETAALVLMYKQNDSRIYTSSSPWMIVASKKSTKEGTVVSGYQGTSYSVKKVTVSEENGPSVAAIGKGDIIRYILDANNEMIDYQIWFDASDPVQLTPVSDADDVYDDGDEDTEGANRIIEIHSSNAKPQPNPYPNATFRLQFGTVTQLILNDENDEENIDEETIEVSPIIVEDELDEIHFANDVGTVSKTISSSVKVFYYDRNGRNSEVVTDADLSEILSYEDYESDATRVIIYTASATLRMIYIIAE